MGDPCRIGPYGCARVVPDFVSAEDDIAIAGEAGNGVDAVAAALALRPSATLMDLRMPDVDGVEAIARIKALYDKLGVADRAAAVAHAYDANILTPRNS